MRPSKTKHMRKKHELVSYGLLLLTAGVDSTEHIGRSLGPTGEAWTVSDQEL
jgi:hypothetical protein